MKILLLGSTGMLGQALQKKFENEDIKYVTASRTNGDYQIDLAKDLSRIINVIEFEQPTVVINAAALVDLHGCENDPELAYQINAKLPSVLNEICRKINIYFVQISTDHFYINDERMKHNETSEVFLLNEYARTKFAGECFALTSKKTLVIRTNIVGFRNKYNQPTFIEWIINSINSQQDITGYDDYFTSSIDVYNFADILVELLNKKVFGLINIGSKDVLSKFEFIEKLTMKFDMSKNITRGTITTNKGLIRATSLGLDTTKVQRILGAKLIPNSDEVIDRLMVEYKRGVKNEL